MAKKRPTNRTNKPNKPNAHEVITAKIIELMEGGTNPWRKTWSAQTAPKNAASGKTYRGINLFLLACMPYESAVWMTFKQAQTLGGCVRKGEKGTPVIFWKWLEKDSTDDDGETTTRRIPMLRNYTVFNIEQIDGIDPAKLPAELTPTTYDHSPIEECEMVVDGMNDPPKIEVGPKPCYVPALDEVRMPSAERFETAEEYYGTLFHELTHATGHASRLNRDGITSATAHFGDSEYSREELVAELGAAFLCGHCRIDSATIDNSAAYLAGWVKVLKSDSRMIATAAAAAQKAADRILGVTFDN